jgi:hypothetical protein
MGVSSVFRVVRTSPAAPLTIGEGGGGRVEEQDEGEVADLAAVQRIVAACIREQRSLQQQYISEISRAAVFTFDAAVRKKSEALSFMNLSPLSIKYATSLV